MNYVLFTQRVIYGPAVLALSGTSFVFLFKKCRLLGPSPDPWNQNLHFNKMPPP